MIKVNLLRDATNTSIKKDGGTFSTKVGEGTRLSGDVNNKAILIRILIPVLGYFSSMFYVHYIEGQKKELLAKVEAQVKAKTAEAEGFKGDIGTINNFKKEKDRLQVQIDTIKMLSKERLRNVKALEAIQTMIPEKVWLISLKIKENQADFEGRASEDRVVADFMAVLEDNIYFSDVKLLKTSDVQSNEGTVKSFSIQSNLEGL